MRPVTYKQLMKAELGLQTVLFIVPRKYERKVSAAMRLLNDIGMEMRRKAVFSAGARARKPIARFEGQKLGSSESCNFFDGYASTHPTFQHPYRSPRR